MIIHLKDNINYLQLNPRNLFIRYCNVEYMYITILHVVSSINQKHQNYTNKNGDHDANICNTFFIEHDKELYSSSFRLSF